MSDEATPADREEAFEAFIVDIRVRNGFLAGYDASAARVAELEAALERIRDASPRNTNSDTAESMASWTYAVAATALGAARASTPGEGEKT